KRTGLTSRALRFYEARGLLKPLRTYSGRRLYGHRELERIQQILALKRAGLSLAQIGKLTAQGNMDFGAIVDAQLKVIEERKAELDEAKALLLSVKSRIDRGEPVDAETFCSLIRQGDKIMEAQDWKKVTDRYFSPEEQARWAEKMKEAPAEFDQQEYGRKWADLGARVEAAIPNGPDSPEAQALYDEWQALLAPFTAVATPEMMSGATKLYERMDEWHGDAPQAPFTPEAFKFIQEIGRGRKGKA
ncbi:MAG TPA: MerR family transcriptional regulator, partial [Sphingomicrobium sp.]|nr:MerR family transcriptional regulator [Sphingomicrobium sp.]